MQLCKELYRQRRPLSSGLHCKNLLIGYFFFEVPLQPWTQRIFKMLFWASVFSLGFINSHQAITVPLSLDAHKPSHPKSQQVYLFHLHQSRLSSQSPALCHFNEGPDHSLCWSLQQPPDTSPCLHSCLCHSSKGIFWNLKSDCERFFITLRIKSEVLGIVYNASHHLGSLIVLTLASSHTIHFTRITGNLSNIPWFPHTFLDFSQVDSTV